MSVPNETIFLCVTFSHIPYDTYHIETSQEKTILTKNRQIIVKNERRILDKILAKWGNRKRSYKSLLSHL